MLKVGGLADIVRDAPVELARRGWEPTVLTPAYGTLAQIPEARRVGTVDVPFAGRMHVVGVYELRGADGTVRCQLVEHPLFTPRGPGLVYCSDGADAPFATDATKFAFLSATAAALVVQTGLPDVVHLHDWHTGLYFALRAFDPRYAALRKIWTVFSIHNLAFQGTRPLAGYGSSLQSWFPGLRYRREAVVDPHHTDCVNPLVTAIRLADRVHTVSPTYAEEIQRRSLPSVGFTGGEGLEEDLRAAARHTRLTGILNGCMYPAESAPRSSWREFVRTAQAELLNWITAAPEVASTHYLAEKKLASLARKEPGPLLTSIGRITSQKVQLFGVSAGTGANALEEILQSLEPAGLLVMLGSGDPALEEFMTRMALKYDNFLFLRGYSEHLAEMLYGLGDLFLMPSSFEPCGISQMLAMRAGQPCVVHAVGGLKDTVTPASGFLFEGDTPTEQAEQFVATVRSALDLRQGHPRDWQKLRRAAAAVRFSWAHSMAEYEAKLYARSDRA
jgi:starch synthase